MTTVVRHSPLAESAAHHDEAVLVAPCADGAAWDAYLAGNQDATVDHDWAWRPVFERVFRHECLYLSATRAGRVVGILPLVIVRSVIFGRALVSLPFLNYGGVLADDAAAAQALLDGAKDAARTLQVSHVELRHSRRQSPALPARQHKVALRLALPASSDALWQGIDRKIRNQVRKARKEGLCTRSGGAELVDDFYGVFARNMRDLGTPVAPRGLFAETISAFGDRARITVVARNDRTIAAGLVVRANAVTLNPWASSLREFRQYCPNVLLYWTMLEAAIADGAGTFDFGRSTIGSGPHHFKLQWGAVEQFQHWEYILLSQQDVPDQGPTSARFRVAVAAWQRLPLWLANAIGPVLSRHLP